MCDFFKLREDQGLGNKKNFKGLNKSVDVIQHNIEKSYNLDRDDPYYE